MPDRAPPVLRPGATIGILGGGQLGRMLAQAAAKLGLHCHIFSPQSDSCAFEVVRRSTIADYSDVAALDAFAADCDVITYEFENVPAQCAAFLKSRKPVLPDPAVLERTIAEHFPGLKPRDLGLRLGLFGGEAGLDNPEFRRRLEATWGFAVRNANYGVTDVFCNFAGQSESDSDLHFVALDILHPELIDPMTAAVLPWREGTRGELVLSHMSRECQPLVRFRTGDIVVLTGTGRAACGRTAPRFRVVGRSDDMVVVRGINAFPTQVAAVLGQFSALSGEYRIVLDGPGPYDVLPVEVEAAEETLAEQGLAAAVEARIKRDIGISARVAVLPFAALPRSEGKTRRVIRRN